MGSQEVAAAAYFGMHTVRAFESLTISAIAVSTSACRATFEDSARQGVSGIPEVVNQVNSEVAGHSVTISIAAEAGQLRLDAFEPIIADGVLTFLRQLNSAYRKLLRRWIIGITANGKQHCESVTNSVRAIIALSPYIDYAASAGLRRRWRPDVQYLKSLGRRSFWVQQVAHLLKPENLVSPWELLSL